MLSIYTFNPMNKVKCVIKIRTNYKKSVKYKTFYNNSGCKSEYIIYVNTIRQQKTLT